MKLKLGTRGSRLALVQAQIIKDALEQLQSGVEVEQVLLKTLGDRKQGTSAASQSDKKDWIYDLECAILDKRIDFAQHSGKDVPSDIEPGTDLVAVLPRVSPFDCFVGRKIDGSGRRLSFADLPKGAKVGTASLRRRAELLRLRPDLAVVEHRGNVPTRIRKLDQSDDLMGIILATAGIERLELSDIDYEVLSADQMMPALSQGTLVAQFRESDDGVREILHSISDPHAYAEWRAERSVAEVLEGDCKSAISIFARAEGGGLSLTSRVMSPDGRDCVEVSEKALLDDAHELGTKVGKILLEKGAGKIIEEARDFRI